jgi:hypothetical protein
MLAAVEDDGLGRPFVLENNYFILVVKVNAVFFFRKLHFYQIASLLGNFFPRHFCKQIKVFFVHCDNVDF